ncbi:MAG TPA: dihydroorotase, partial [Rhodothermales bacterium]|nr:dihydroorotase [Rhodothermales bacterium]
MPDLLLSGGLLLDLDTGDTTRADLLIRDGVIAQIGEISDAEGAEVVDISGKLISPGWMDMHVHFREPGQEHKETIETGARAAAWGG